MRGAHLRVRERAGPLPGRGGDRGGPGAALQEHLQEVFEGPRGPARNAQHVHPALHPLLQAQRGAGAGQVRGAARARPDHPVRHDRARADHARRLPEQVPVRGDHDALPQLAPRAVPAVRHAHVHRGAHAGVRGPAAGVGPRHVARLPQGRAAPRAREHAAAGRGAFAGAALRDRQGHHPQALDPVGQRGEALQLAAQVRQPDPPAARRQGIGPGRLALVPPGAPLGRGARPAAGPQAGRQAAPEVGRPRGALHRGPVDRHPQEARGPHQGGLVPLLLPARPHAALGRPREGARRRGSQAPGKGGGEEARGGAAPLGGGGAAARRAGAPRGRAPAFGGREATGSGGCRGGAPALGGGKAVGRRGCRGRAPQAGGGAAPPRGGGRGAARAGGGRGAPPRGGGGVAPHDGGGSPQVR
mmetsp:Transcript_84523/g.258053  ORF Transcript_84523/g.258053 Transcript_84523/m.258053 type:complete len:415 (+) Transcript_84523:1953-3197(+)